MAVKKHTLDLSDKIMKDIVFKKADNAIEGPDAFENNLPEGMTMEVVNSVNSYETDFIAASTHAFGVMALDALKDDNSLESVSGVFPMGEKNNVSHTMARTAERHVPGSDESVTKYGVVTSTYYVHGSKGSKGQLAQVRKELSEIAEAALK